MSRFLRKKVVTMLEELTNIYNELCSRVQKQEGNAHQELFQECQNRAICLGTFLEEVNGESYIPVRKLEVFCENIYLLFQCLDEQDQSKRTLNELTDCISSLPSILKQDFPDKYEIVFMPYKVSMWDSLESIYLAAEQDSDFEAFVVPIPYYEKDKSGNRLQLLCENRNYPAQISVLNWEDYNVKVRKPDFIVIHNPYDDRNLVTSVHPDYYAKELVKYTTALVYVPYFVLKEIRPGDYNLIEDLKQYCFLPGTIFAKYVFVQSETVREIYCREFDRICRENGLPYPYEETARKFIGIGSPKFDKIEDGNAAWSGLPSEWRKRMNKGAGQTKRIIFYNTSIVALLTHKEAMLQKIEAVLKLFWTNRKDVVLLWRPHPLYRSTLNAMLPEYLDRYDRIVENYKDEGWGILDPGYELSKVIAVSDAYYGDDSSVVELFKKAGKPILLQNVLAGQDQTCTMPAMEASLTVGDRLWFVPLKENALYSYDVNENQIRYHSKFTLESGSNLLYCEIVFFDDKLYFIPKLARYLAVYHRELGKMEYLDVFRDFKIEASGALFGSAFQEGRTLYLIPVMFKFLVKMDMETHTFEYYDLSFGKTGEKNGAIQDRIYCFRNMVQIKNKLFLPLFTDRIVAVFDLLTNRLSQIKPSGMEIAADDVFYRDGMFYLLSCEDHMLAVWEPEDNQIVDQMSLPANFSPYRRNFYLSVQCGGRIYLFQMHTGHCLVIDPVEKTVKEFELLADRSDEDWYFNEFFKFCKVWTIGDKPAFMSGIDGAQFVIDDTEKLQLKSLPVAVCYEQGTLEKMLEQGVVMEQSGTSANLLNYFKIRIEKEKRIERNSQTVGYNILCYLKENELN